jgi:phenylalanyl-tRNA synthetase alpha chain
MLLKVKCLAGCLGQSTAPSKKLLDLSCYQFATLFSIRTKSSISSARPVEESSKTITVLGNEYEADDWTNITPRIVEKTGLNLHMQLSHPLWLVKKRISNFFYASFPGASAHSCPLFTVVDNFSPVVSTTQNFDELLVPRDHVSRAKSDNYYINKDTVLRAHTSAHQKELMRSGLGAFLMFGDVYRRDTIDATHYPVFHQCEGVRLFRENDLFPDQSQSVDDPLRLFTQHARSADHQETLTMEGTKLLEFNLKSTLEDLIRHLLEDSGLKMRWVPEYFPFTHPSWELEIEHEGKWLEILGCGVIEQQIVNNAGCEKMAGWAFGIGLERVAMLLYNIPDIRMFWSQDSRFLNQFLPTTKDINANISFQPFSRFTALYNDISLWVPADFQPNDFFDLVRNEGGEIVENVDLVDEYKCEKTDRHSKTYRLTFRHFEKVLTQEEVTSIRANIEDTAESKLNAVVRR